MANVRKLVLAYSGGLDTSVAIRWISELYDCEVIAYCADVGQGEDLEAARDKALKVGVSKALIGDLRLEFSQFFRREAHIYLYSNRPCNVSDHQ